MAKLSQKGEFAGGVVRSPSPVCQMPNLFRPAELWKPHTPDVLYSHIGLGLMFVAVLAGWRIGTHPPLLRSKFHGTLSLPGVGPVAERRMPRSRRLFGTTSSPGSRMPLLFTSSPRVLLTTVLPVPIVVNRDEKVTSSSCNLNRSTGSMTSCRWMSWLRL